LSSNCTGKGLPADPRSVAVALVHADLIDHVGGVKYLAGLLDNLPDYVSGHAAGWAEFLVELAAERRQTLREPGTPDSPSGGC